jgi:hypothetical protein
MKFLLKLILGISIFLACLIGIGFLILTVEDYQESKFHNIEIPESLKFEKTIESLTNKQIDSLENINVEKNKILVIGKGYIGYSFYMWHKPIEKGEIFIKAFELTQKTQISDKELKNKTTNKITEFNENHKLYSGYSLIYEGTFENFYPVRFELWFKSENTGIEKKLAEKKYLIDGWDR